MGNQPGSLQQGGEVAQNDDDDVVDDKDLISSITGQIADFGTSATNKITNVARGIRKLAIKPLKPIPKALKALNPLVMTGGANNKDKGKGRGHHLRVIFAAPLDMLGVSAQTAPPTIAHTAEETEFIINSIRSNFVFDDLSDRVLSELVKVFEIHTIDPAAGDKTEFITQGDTNDFYFYILKEGKCEIILNGATVGYAEEGDSFGELALLYNAPRAATVQAVRGGPVVLYRVHQRAFRYVLKHTTEDGTTRKIELLKKVPFLADLSTHELNKLQANMLPRKFSANDDLSPATSKILGIGSPGSKADPVFAIVESGTVHITNIVIGGTPYGDMTLKAGDFAGQQSIMTDTPFDPNIKATALSDGILFIIPKSIFLKVLGSYEDLLYATTVVKRLVHRISIQA
jgi:cAMP-dependent protein kinase regulator